MNKAELALDKILDQHAETIRLRKIIAGLTEENDRLKLELEKAKESPKP